jgi:hypothetical protein
MYQQVCFAGGTVLRLAKDLTVNNKGACVLVVCSEVTPVTFCGPSVMLTWTVLSDKHYLEMELMRSLLVLTKCEKLKRL